MCEPLRNSYASMTSTMAYKLNGYLTSLEYRYGDPRVYEMEALKMAEQDAKVSYTQAHNASEALHGAYETARSGHRTDHALRMASRLAEHRAPEKHSRHPNPQPPAEAQPQP